MWQLYIVHGQGAVQIRTEGVRNCRLQQSSRNGGVNCHARSWNHNPQYWRYGTS